AGIHGAPVRAGAGPAGGRAFRHDERSLLPGVSGAVNPGCRWLSGRRSGCDIVTPGCLSYPLGLGLVLGVAPSPEGSLRPPLLLEIIAAPGGQIPGPSMLDEPPVALQTRCR